MPDAIKYVLKLLIRDRDISVDDINLALKRKGLTRLSPIAISSIKSRLFATLKVLDELGMLKISLDDFYDRQPKKRKRTRYSCSDDPEAVTAVGKKPFFVF